jgi:hypothetical protein
VYIKQWDLFKILLNTFVLSKSVSLEQLIKERL